MGAVVVFKSEARTRGQRRGRGRVREVEAGLGVVELERRGGAGAYYGFTVGGSHRRGIVHADFDIEGGKKQN